MTPHLPWYRWLGIAIAAGAFLTVSAVIVATQEPGYKKYAIPPLEYHAR